VTLDESYKRCRKLNRTFGSTYYWSAALLPKHQRKHVHALYAFCRYADDIVDHSESIPVAARAAALQDFGDIFFRDLETGSSQDPILAAVVNTVMELRIDPECFQRFLKSMHMDFTISTYETFDDLMVYMDGSAAVIGEMMLNVLEPGSPEAFSPARDLGIAFQLTNFLRDVGEDARRGRIYVPQDTLRRFGAAPDARSITPEWADAIRFEIARTRRIYANADAGIDLLPERSAECIRAARTLYSGILERIEANGYDVFSQRARVPAWRKLATAARLVA